LISATGNPDTDITINSLFWIAGGGDGESAAKAVSEAVRLDPRR